MADKRLVESLISARNAVKRKFRELQSDIVQHENYMEKKFKPISDPIKQLLQNIKHEKLEAKPEPFSLNPQTSFVNSTPNKEEDKVETAKTPLRLSMIRPRRISFEQPDTQQSIADNDDDIAAIQPEQEMKELEKSQAFQDYMSSFGGLAKTYVAGWRLDTKGEYDNTYGPRVDIRKDEQGREYDTGKFLLGNSEIDFKDDGTVIYITTPDGIKHPYKGSTALYELIFKKEPTKATIERNPEAALAYKDILKKTNVHRFDFDPAKQIKGNTGVKYVDFIKPILKTKFKDVVTRVSPTKQSKPRTRAQTMPSQNKSTAGSSKSKAGGGILKLNNRLIQYVPYKNVNTLVNRLKVLIGAKSAGNNAHDNEITYIIDELKRIKVIQ